MKTCQTCRLYLTPKCWWRKEEGKDPGPSDWCAGWKKKKGEKG